jgi:serine/threonine-protein kinase RsbW
MADHQAMETTRVDTRFDSTLDSVDRAEELVLEAAATLGFDEEEVHRLGMAVREAMVNAVVHGNRYSSERKVHFRLLAGAAHLRVVVRDEGEGFDFDTLPDPTSEENLLRQSGRGFLLMKAFADECHVRRTQPRGTEVELLKRRAEG